MLIILGDKRAKTCVIIILIMLVILAGFGLRKITETIMTVVSPRLVPIYSVETNEKKVAISLDATWGADYTDEILKLLREYDIKTTFFLCGRWIKEYPKVVQRISAEGHEIGNHSTTHPDMSLLSRTQVQRELIETHNLIFEFTGQDSRVFRPPFGAYNNNVIEVAGECDYFTVQWSVDSLDWKDLTEDQIVGRVLSRVHNGAIILFHNNGTHTANALRQIISSLQKDGYKIVPVSELLIKEDYYIDRNTGQQKRRNPDNVSERETLNPLYYNDDIDVLGRVIERGNTKRPEMALSFNVAWGEEYIPGLLDVLDMAHVKVSFFFVGTWVNKFPDLTREIAERGHEVANHGYEHCHVENLSLNNMKELIKENERLLLKVAQRTSKLFAPPYGEFGGYVPRAAEEVGYKTIRWTIDTIDWSGPAPEEIVKRVTERAENGAIVLMHPTLNTLEALPVLLKELKKMGYTVTTVSGILAEDDKIKD